MRLLQVLTSGSPLVGISKACALERKSQMRKLVNPCILLGGQLGQGLQFRVWGEFPFHGTEFKGTAEEYSSFLKSRKKRKKALKLCSNIGQIFVLEFKLELRGWLDTQKVIQTARPEAVPGL